MARNGLPLWDFHTFPGYAPLAARSDPFYYIVSTDPMYPLAQHSWDDRDVITVSSLEDQLISTFPLDFIRRGGLNTWEYILDVVGQLVEGNERGMITAQDGSSVEPTEVPQAGDYIYVPAGKFPDHFHAK
jgi:hypothetical protein